MLAPCSQDLRNPGIHTYLAGIYRLFIKRKKSHAYSNASHPVMSTYDQIAQMPESCGLMDAKSGKSFLVTGMGSGNDLNFGEEAVAI